MNRKECRVTRRQIDQMDLGNELGEGAAAHLAGCADCRQFRRERAELRGLIGSLEPVTAPADFETRLRARIASERRPGSGQPFFARLIGMPAIAAAAVMVLFAGTILWIAERPNRQLPATPSKETVATVPAAPVQPNSRNEAPSATSPSGGNDLALASEGGRNLTGRNKGRRNVPYSRDFYLTSAPRISKNDPDQVLVNASNPVEVSLEDDKGATRKISLPPVSFGSQSLVNNRLAVSYNANSRIW